MKPFVLSMKYPGFPVVEFRMINHRITHIFRKRTQNEQKNYCCIQRTTQEPSALRICSKKAFVVQIPLFCKRLGGSFTRMNSCHVWRPVGALMKKRALKANGLDLNSVEKRFLRDYGFPDSIDLQLCRMVQYLLVEQYFLERFPQFPLFFSRIIDIYKDGHIVLGWSGRFASHETNLENENGVPILPTDGSLIIW